MTQPFPFDTERHQDETPPSSIHPVDFTGNTDPALDPDNNVQAGKRWLKGDWAGGLAGTREQYIRNAANDAWVKLSEYPVSGASGSFAPVVDVSGLVADGTTDDTTALQALIDANPDDVVFDGGGALYKITALDFPAMNRVTFRNWRFTVPGDTVPISASGLVYDCRFESIFITAGSQSTAGRRIWDFTNFSNCTFRHIRTYGVDNVSDHWYGTKNGAGSAPYYNRFEELYAGTGRYLVNCVDAGSTATGPNANTWADCRFQPQTRTAVRVMKFCQSLVFQNVTIEATGVGYEMNGRGCTIRGGYMEGLATGIHLDTDSYGCVVDFPYFSGVTTKIDDDGTDNVVFGHRDDIGTVVDNVTGGAPGAHASSHEDGGGDDLDVTLLAGYPGGGTTFLRDDGTFAAPGGGSIPTGGRIHEVLAKTSASDGDATWRHDGRLESLAPAGAADKEFNSSTIGGAALGSPTTCDADTTYPGALYISKAANASFGLHGRYWLIASHLPAAVTIPFTVDAELQFCTGYNTRSRHGLYIMDSTPAVNIGIMVEIPSATGREWTISTISATTLTSGAAYVDTSLFTGLQMCQAIQFRIVVTLSTNVAYYWRWRGQPAWSLVRSGHNPGFTVAAVGLSSNSENAGFGVESAWSHLRFS